MPVTISRETFDLPRAPEEGAEILAIGDIHGCAELLDALLETAAREPKRAARRVLVFTGDLVDRGPRNLDALRLAREGQVRIGADELIPLMGNHEALMRLALEPEVSDPDSLDAFGTWLRNGGREVLREFAEPDPTAPLHPDEWRDFAARALPAPVREWLGGLRSHAISGGLLFVHAGINPAIPLERFLAAPWNTPIHALQVNRHWAWVRAPFLGHAPGPAGYSGHLVVHGHTPRDGGHAPRHADQIARFRLNLDAGSYYTGEAKLALIRGRSVEVFTAVAR